MPLVYIQVYDFLEELIEGLVAVRYYQSSLVRKVVIDVVYYLYCHVRLSRPYFGYVLKTSQCSLF